MAIYFPSTRTRLDRKYTPFVGTEPAALTGWLNFLNGLYDAIAIVGTSASAQCQSCVKLANTCCAWANADHACQCGFGTAGALELAGSALLTHSLVHGL